MTPAPLSRRNRVAALVTLGVGIVCALVAWALVGTAGLGSSALGTVLVLAFFSAGMLPFLVAGDGSQAGLAFLVLGMTYVLRVLLGAVVYVAADRVEGVSSKAVGLTVIACALAWLNTQVLLGLSRRHQPVLDV